MKSTSKILLVALAAGALGVVASLASTGPGPLLGLLLRSDTGQRAVQLASDRTAPPAPAGLVIAREGGPMPVIRLPGLDGTTVALPAATAGRPLLINFWASWCAPCIAEMPALDRFARDQPANSGVQVVGIALDDRRAVQAFLQRTPVAYPILLDRAGPADSGVQLGNRHGVLPYSVLVGADGRLRKRKLGPFQPGEIDSWVD